MATAGIRAASDVSRGIGLWVWYYGDDRSRNLSSTQDEVYGDVTLEGRKLSEDIGDEAVLA